MRDRRNRPRSRTGSATILVLCVLVGWTCTARDRAAGSDGDTLTVLVGSVNWWMWNLPSHAPVFLSLFAERDGEVEGRLVRDWEQGEGGRWVYHLRTDVRWHDGVPVTARDVKFTLDLLSHPDLLHLPPGAATAEVLDDSTVAITFRKLGSDRRWSPLETGMPIYPAHLLADLDPADFFDWTFWQHPVGNGPYRFVRGIPREMVELEANPDFVFGQPLVDHVILKLGGDARLDLLAGDVDIADVFSVEPEVALQSARDQDIDAYWMLGDWMYVILWNPRHPILGDARVRRALTLAVDTRELAATLWYPEDVPLFDLPTTSRQRARQDLPAPLPHDPGAAAALLEQAGWRDADGDGIRERDGVPLRFTLLTRTENLAVLIQDHLLDAGAEAEVQTMPGKDAQLVQAGEFDAFLVGGFSTSAPRLREFLLERSYLAPDPELQRILSAADTATDPAVLDGLYEEMWPVLRSTTPVSMLLPSLWVSLAQRRVRGLASPQSVIAAKHLHELWIEEEEP